MPYRAMNVALGVLGVMVLIALVVLGVNVYRSARTGPRWKRALIAAGLLVLGLATTNSCKQTTCYAPVKPDDAGQRQQESKTPLEKTPEWKTIQGAWDFVGPLAESGKSTEAQRKQADERFKTAKSSMDKLVAAGLLSPAESGLLQAQADTLREEVYRNPPTDPNLVTPTCYAMIGTVPARQSLQELSKRLPLLQHLAQQDRLHESVLARLVPTIEADVKTLTDEKELAKLQPKERAEAEKLRPQVEKALADFKQRMEKSE